MRRAHKIDANQNRVVEHLRRCGLSVSITSMVGNGFADLIVGGNKKNILVELKDPSQPPSQRKLTEDEQKFHDSWRGQIIIATTAEDILKHF